MKRHQIKTKIKAVKKRRRDAIQCAYLNGSNHPTYDADATRYDYAIKILKELLNEEAATKD